MALPADRTPELIRLVVAGMLLGGLGIPAAAWAGVTLLLRSGDLAPYRAAEEGFRATYRDAIVTLDASSSDADDIARRVRKLRPDVVVAIGVRAAVLARDHLRNVPVVYCAVPHPGRHDLVGDWITGVNSDVDPALEIEALVRADPSVRSIGYLHGATSPPAERNRARAAAKAAGIKFVEMPLASAEALPGAARRLAPLVDALWLSADPMIANAEGFSFLLALSLEFRLPLLAFSDALVRKGALVAVTPDYAEAGQRAAQLVRRIEGGDRPVDLPFAAVSGMRTVMNQATARALGTPLSGSAMRSADVVP
jgi:putative tryptophan/tyrosine transport system substrate-binding protein